MFFENFIFSLRRAQAARGPLLSAPAESRQRQAQGSFTPLRIPGPKWGAGRPPLETPKSSLARQTRPNSSPLRGWSFGAVGKGRERVRARLDFRTSTASGWGLRPLAPQGSPKGKVCRSCAPLGASPPCPQGSPLGNVRLSCAHAHGTTSETAFAAKPTQICAEAPAATRRGVPPSPRANCGRRPRQRDRQGESQRGRSPLWPVFAYFLLARK